MSAVLISEISYGNISMEFEDHHLTALLAKKDEAAFEQIFKTYFKSLHAYAYTILKNETEAEEMVQQVFFKLWERAGNLSFSGSIAAYLYRAVHNESLNYFRHRKVRSVHQMHVAYNMKQEAEQPAKKIMSKELEGKFRAALNDLPEQCRTIFQLSRFEEMKYREIADKLGISIKTVENQMGKALKILRIKLVDFLVMLFLFIHF